MSRHHIKIAAIVAAAISLLASTAEAKDLYQVEQMFRMSLGDAANCDAAWQATLAETPEILPPYDVSTFPPPRPLVVSIHQEDDFWCIVTLFSRHFQPYCDSADSHCMAPPEDDF